MKYNTPDKTGVNSWRNVIKRKEGPEVFLVGARGAGKEGKSWIFLELLL